MFTKFSTHLEVKRDMTLSIIFAEYSNAGKDSDFSSLVPPPPSMLSCACCNAVLAAKTFFWFAKKDIVRKTLDGSELLHGGYPVAVETGVIAVAVETGVIAVQ